MRTKCEMNKSKNKIKRTESEEKGNVANSMDPAHNTKANQPIVWIQRIIPEPNGQSVSAKIPTKDA